MRSFTHTQLVNVARKWLARSSSVVITEMASYGLEEADAIGFRADGCTTLVECKVSRADFLSDKQKAFRAVPDLGMGAQRYYLTPMGLVTSDECPAGWGLLTWNGRRVHVFRESSYFAERAHGREVGMLVSALRRLGLPVRDGVNVRCYTRRAEGRPRATLGIIAPG